MGWLICCFIIANSCGSIYLREAKFIMAISQRKKKDTQTLACVLVFNFVVILKQQP